MTNVALDTNIWIYLTKDAFFELWQRFKEMKNAGEIKVIVNDIIMSEWHRNKQTTIENLTKAIKNELSSALNLSNHLSKKEKQTFEEALTVYKSEADRIAIATQRVQEIEDFMMNCTLIEATEKQKLFVADLAINKLPPFQNNKNNFNDALIFRNIHEFVDLEYPREYDLIYVSNNPSDFTDKQTGEVHPSLMENLKQIRFKNVSELGEALKLAPELIADFDEWLEYHLNREADYQLDLARGK